jgi:phosphoribosylformylglycinamidine synthase
MTLLFLSEHLTQFSNLFFSGNCGIDIELRVKSQESREVIASLFSEELGMVIEYLPENENEISETLTRISVPFEIIGTTTDSKLISVRVHGEPVLDEDMRVLRDTWEETSYQLEKLQANPECASEERKNNFDRPGPQYIVNFTPEDTPIMLIERDAKPKVAIIREEGSNSDREMTSAFYQAGFEPWDIAMTDILNKRINLSDFKGVAFVGGFSYADVLDSAKGWAGVIRFNKRVWEDFQEFYNRTDTFSLGICNGCQLMALLGWVPWQGITDSIQPRFIHNNSGRFESRFSSVRILPSPSLMLKDMEGSVLGIWVAHGEGKAFFPDETILNTVVEDGLAPIRYADDNNEITSKYPFNPNGSVQGIASLCFSDGRHLAIMPHPERTFLKWQWPWMPADWRQGLNASPWLKMFQNARQWCETT